MAENATVARPYARAAFARARELKALGEWSQLLAAGAALARNREAAELFGNPRVVAGELVEFIAGVASDAGATVGADGRNFLALLQENGRMALLPEIAQQFEALKSEAENSLDVEVTSAIALNPAQRAALEAALGKRFGRNIRLEEKVDASLVGGAVVRAGDLVIDGSLRGSLARLEQQMSQP